MRNWCASISVNWPSRRLRRKRQKPLRPKNLRRALLPLVRVPLLNPRQNRLPLHPRQELRALRLRLLRLEAPSRPLRHIRLPLRRQDPLPLHLRPEPPLRLKDRHLRVIQFSRRIRPRQRSNAPQLPALLLRARGNLVPECRRALERHSGRQVRHQRAKDRRCAPDNRSNRVPVRRQECARPQHPASHAPEAHLVLECHSGPARHSARAGLRNAIRSVLEDVPAKVPVDSARAGNAPEDRVLADPAA